MRRTLIGGLIVGLVALVSTNSWGASGDQPVYLNSANIGATISVSVSGTASIRPLNKDIDGVKIYGDQGLPFKQDSAGQIFTITAPETGTIIRYVYPYTNIAAGAWVEIGSFTVTTGKTLKIYDVVATGRFAVDYKIFTGTAGKELYLATSPSFATANLTISRPLPITGGTIVRLYVKPDTAVNDGTIAVGGFEY